MAKAGKFPPSGKPKPGKKADLVDAGQAPSASAPPQGDTGKDKPDKKKGK